MLYKKIEAYMNAHDFLRADRDKIHKLISNINNTCSSHYQIVDGYLTRTCLILFSRNGMKHTYSRELIGIQDNFR